MKTKEAPRVIKVELTDPHVFTHHYEVAAWYTLIACEPQEHTIERTKTTGGFDYHASLPGIIRKKHTPSLFGGVPISGAACGDEQAKGTPQNYNLHIPGWYLRSLIGKLENPAKPFELPGESPIRITVVTPG